MNKSSVQYRLPPEPDILCKVGEEIISFELGELIDRDFAQRVFPAMSHKQQLEDVYEKLSEKKKQAIKRRVGNALINFEFVPTVTAKVRKQNIPRLIDFLETVEDDQLGEIEPPRELRKVLKQVRILRGGFNGPFFDIMSAGFLGDPTIELINEKFMNTYKTNYPIELISYFELQPVIDPIVWLPKLKEHIESNIQSSPYKRVWVVEIPKKIVHFVFPNLNAGYGI